MDSYRHGLSQDSTWSHRSLNRPRFLILVDERPWRTPLSLGSQFPVQDLQLHKHLTGNSGPRPGDSSHHPPRTIIHSCSCVVKHTSRALFTPLLPQQGRQLVHAARSAPREWRWCCSRSQGSRPPRPPLTRWEITLDGLHCSSRPHCITHPRLSPTRRLST